MLLHTRKHGHTSPAPHASRIHAFKGMYYIINIDTSLASLIELVGEDIQHQFRVAFGVDMPMCFEVKEVLQGLNKSN